MDDLLKSVYTHDVASKLIDKVRKISKAEVLTTIPEEDKRKGVKNQDLITGSLPT